MILGRKVILIILGGLVLSSCMTNTPNISRLDEVGHKDAVLVTRLVGVDTSGMLTIHGGFGSGSRADISVRPGEQLKVIKIKSGKKLKISSYSVGGRTAYFNKKPFTFVANPKTVTYIGDIFVKENWSDVSLRVIDNEAETVAVAKNQYPYLFSEFGYKKNVASDDD